MKRVVFAAFLSTVALAVLPGLSAHAQLFGNNNSNRDGKTGRTEEGVKIDQEIDRLYRSRTGQKTPEVRSDPWGDVRTAPAQNAPQPAAKTTAKPKS
ncbi:MAG TPA: hypothetical protein VM867_10680 [Xanthobacteraceae bacterium]|nr:hypothetical protein [Xanthobacteraceae bacterium]